MRHNGRPALKASEIRPNRITLYPGEPITVVCGDCSTWRRLRRKMITPHRLKDRGHGARKARCPGSGQRITIDLTSEAWQTAFAAHLEAAKDASKRRGTKVVRKPQPAPTPAVSQMRVATLSQVRGAQKAHALYGCRECQSGRLCETGRDLDQRIKRFALQQLQRQQLQRR
ncbi:hypothetical protein [Streptomyces sp. 7N604]|uniref:hypothetical protein n=1 Tax=Streptomyces sp. 7N604 TaxID=3457415 RepID=UPI003FD64BB6